MFKNVASQKIQLFAFDATTSVPKTGDAANITAYVSKDHGAVTVLGDTSATEMEATNAPGVYVFDLTQGETNGDELTFSAKSSTANIKIVPRFVSTNPPSFTASVAQTGDSYAVVNSGTFGNSALKTLIDAVDDFVDTEVAAIKAKTDQLTFTVANQVDANALSFATSLRAGIRKNVALANFEILMTDSTNHNPATALTVTITRSIDGGAFAAGTLGAVSELSNGIYKFDFAAGDLNGVVVTLRAVAVGADDLFLTIHTDP